MAKLTLKDPGANYRSVAQITDNNTAIEAAIENTLSRDGTGPNQMGAELDMNSNKITNLAEPTNNTDAARKQDIDSGIGADVTTVANNITAVQTVSTNIADVTAVSTDLSGADTIGDAAALLAVASPGLVAKNTSGSPVSRTLTGGTGISVTNGDGGAGNPTITLDTELVDIAGITPSDGVFIVGDGADFVGESGDTALTSLGAGTTGIAVLKGASDSAIRTTLNLGSVSTLDVIDEDNMASDSATAVPTQQSVKAYADSLADTVADINAITQADGVFIVSDGTNWTGESGATARTSLGVSIGSDVQAYDAGLASIAGLTTSADQLIYTTGADTYAAASLTAFARTLLDDASASAARATLSTNPGINLVDTYGAVGDGTTDDTTALQNAAASGRMVFVPYTANYYRATGTITLSNGTVFVGDESRPEIRADGVSKLFNMDSSSDTGLRRLTINGNRTDDQSATQTIDMDSATDCLVDDCILQNVGGWQEGGISLGGTAARNRVTNNTFENCYAHSCIHLTNTASNNIVAYNYSDGQTQFGIFFSSSPSYNTIAFNKFNNGDVEGIALAAGANYNLVLGNTCNGNKDNGISISGERNRVIGNTCEGNQRAGIHVWGSFNTVTGNYCLNNNLDSTSGGPYDQWAGIGVSANYGGAGQYNTIVGNVCDDDQSTPSQFNGLRAGGSATVQWATGVSVTADSTATAYKWYGQHIYLATTSGTTGATPPTHTSGEVSDGGVTWRYVRTFLGSLDAGYNNFSQNVTPRASSNLIVDVYSASENHFDERERASLWRDVSYQIDLPTGAEFTIDVNGVEDFKADSTGISAPGLDLTSGVVRSDLIPDGSSTRDLGNSSFPWSLAFVGDVRGLTTLRAGATNILFSNSDGTEGYRYQSSGPRAIRPGTTNNVSLGLATRGWSTVYAHSYYSTDGTTASLVIDSDRVFRKRSYTVATVPSASSKGAGAEIYVSDETGGAVPAFSDGTDWRRVTDRSIIA